MADNINLSKDWQLEGHAGFNIICDKQAALLVVEHISVLPGIAAMLHHASNEHQCHAYLYVVELVAMPKTVLLHTVMQ